MRILVIGILYITYMLFQCPLWLTGGAPYVMRALTYSFFHANLFHLAVNCLSIWFVFYPERRNSVSMLIAGYVVALIVYPLASGPIVGFSNILYAICGMSAQPFRDSYYWSRKDVWTALIAMLLMLILPQFSAVTHIAAYALGLLFMHIRFYLIDPIKRDASKFIHNI